MEFSNILDVKIACLDQHLLLESVKTWIDEDIPQGISSPRILSYVNAHCLNISWTDRAYREILNAMDLVYVDGVGGVWAGRISGRCRLHKLTGADWIDDFCQLAQENHWRIYILAGRPGVAKKAQVNLQHKYPSLDISGACDGYFVEKSERELLEDIAKTTPDVLLVGMGVPLQEKWIAAHISKLSVKICWAVGALFDYVAGIEPRAPRLIRGFALEWLWRMLVDPTGKWKRYLFGNPLFIYRVLRQKWILTKK